MKTYIKGNYRKSIFKNDKGYVIGLFKIRDTNSDTMKDYINKTITFTGYFHELNEDDTYFFYGEEVEHPRYGFQYQVNEYERILPEGKEGVIEFLASDLFPGIGEKMATSIVESLGEHALDLILDDSASLKTVPKLSDKKANKIYEILKKYEESHKTIVELTELGFSMRESLNIYNTYKNKTREILNSNIYKFIEDINDISFLKIDSIALRQNIEENDSRRVKSAIIYVMNELTYKLGDTYLTIEEISSSIEKTIKLHISFENLENYLIELLKEGKIKIEQEKYYLAEIWQAETNIIERVYELNNNNIHSYNKIDEEIKKLEKESNIEYNSNQKDAIKKALQNNLLIITGGPGTGKTTIIKAIVELYGKLNKLDYEELCENIALLAPTGRASKRISESTLLPATTIHRFLKWNKENNKFSVNEYNKDNSKLIIIDEVSMIDINLLDSLFKGLLSDIQIILVGDYHQLPSVGPGIVLKDFIDSDVIETVKLETLYRQDENSYITTLAHEIKDANLSENFLEQRSDYTFLTCNGPSLKKNLNNLCETIIKKGYDYKTVQILAPMYKGENGIDNLNKELQAVFNPKDNEKREIKYGDIIFREKDKILQLVNVPDENIFNGDIGIINHIIYSSTSKSGKNEIYVDFDGNIVKFTTKDFHMLKHGYIISIHKSQGSEFNMVIIPICNSYNRMLYKKLIYTGITRAKQKLILIGEPNAFTRSVYNNNEYIRKTNLLNKLVNKFNKKV